MKTLEDIDIFGWLTSVLFFVPLINLYTFSTRTKNICHETLLKEKGALEKFGEIKT